MASLVSDLAGAATGVASSAVNTTVNANTQERQALQSAYIPDILIDLFQSARRSLGLKAQTGGAVWGVIIGIVVITYIIMVILQRVVGQLMNSPIIRGIFIFAIIVLVAYIVYYLYYKPMKREAL